METFPTVTSHICYVLSFKDWNLRHCPARKIIFITNILTATLEHSAAGPQTARLVIHHINTQVQTVTEGVSIWTVGPHVQCELQWPEYR